MNGAMAANNAMNRNHPRATQNPTPSDFLMKPSASSSMGRASSAKDTSRSMKFVSSVALPAGSSRRRSSGDCSGMADPGVEDGVEHVDGEVDHHVADGDHHDGALEGHRITLADRLHCIEADAVDDEHG